MPAKIIYKEGDLVNGLVFKSEMPSEIMGGQLRRNAMFLCFCGNLFKSRIHDVKLGKVKSCGCINWVKEHGHAIMGNFSAEYRTWLSIKQRCFNPTARFYKRYGGRGITMCDKWVLSFSDFLADVGERPSIYHSIDRHPNNDGNYEPGNVRWATQEGQANNTSRNRLLDYKGEKFSISQWSRKIGLSVGCIIWRLDKLNWSVDKTLSTPKAPLKMDRNNVRMREKYLENKLT